MVRLAANRVRRLSRPREIVIRTNYEVNVELPFYIYGSLTLRPEARAQR